MLWKDDNTNLSAVAFKTVTEKQLTEAKCCDAPEIHIHAHRPFADENKGSAWIWCSHCGRFSHLDRIIIHADWHNNKNVDIHLVCAVPEYLETVKAAVDKHLQEFLKS